MLRFEALAVVWLLLLVLAVFALNTSKTLRLKVLAFVLLLLLVLAVLALTLAMA